jgi:hypothetical protein
MTVAEIGDKMDASELMEWVAYFKIQDPEEANRINDIVESEKSDEYHADKMRAFLNTIRPGKK